MTAEQWMNEIGKSMRPHNAIIREIQADAIADQAESEIIIRMEHKKILAHKLKLVSEIKQVIEKLENALKEIQP